MASIPCSLSGAMLCWHRYTASMLCFERRTLGAVRSMLPYHGLVRPCLHSSCSLRLPFGLIYSALASPPRRRRLAVSFMDRSSPPSGRLAAVLDRCLRFALLWPDGISLPRPVPALRRARFAAFAAHPIPPLHRGAIPCPLRSGSRSMRRLPSLATLVQQGDTVAHLRPTSARLSLRCTCNRDSRTVVVWYLIYPYITTPRTRQEEGRLQRSCIGLLPTGRGALGW